MHSKLLKNIVILYIIVILNQINESSESVNNADLGKFRVVCYYTSWSTYRVGIGKFTPEDIDPYLCTHIIYAFGALTKEVNFIPFDEQADIKLGGYDKFTALKKQNKDLKTMLSFGGWNEGFIRFSSIAADSEKKQKFIKNSIAFLRQHNFDGLDLDWEFPYPQDRLSYSTLIQELREEFEKESKDTNRTRLLLTITVPTEIEHIRNGYDIPKLNKYVDWMNVLTYNYRTSFEPLVSHHSQLYSVNSDYDYELNVNYTISSYLESGVESQKLVLGIPTYGRSYTLSNPNRTKIGSSAVAPGIKGEQSNANGFLTYYEICNKIKEDGWIQEQPYPNAMGPYAYKGNQWVAYDDENMTKKKSEYVVDKKLGGIMFWVIDYDDFRGTCAGKRFPLISAAKEALVATKETLVPL